MRRSELTLLAIVSLVAVTSHAAIDELHLFFSTDSEHTIPALPLTFRVAVTNDSASAIRLPPAIALRVTPFDGKPFVAVSGYTEGAHYVGGWPSEYEDHELVPAHATQTFELPAYQNWPFADDRLTRPGKYVLELILGDRFPSNPDALLDANAVNNRTFVTNGVTTISGIHGAELRSDIQAITGSPGT